MGIGKDMDGNKRRLAIHRSLAARASFKDDIIKINPSMYIKSPGENSSLIASRMGMDAK